MTLMCLATTAGIDPGMDFNVSSPQHNGSYSGRTKKITKIENLKNSTSSTSTIYIIELSIIAALIIVNVLPVLVTVLYCLIVWMVVTPK